ncbi:6374_t:CDS:2, partial [Scutellospora calospora]
ITNLENKPPSNTFIDLLNKQSTSPTTIINKTIDLLERFAYELNEEQKRAYFLVCNHHQKNQSAYEYKLSQLLLYLASTSGTTSTGIATANVYSSTIHSDYRFGFSENSKKLSILLEETLRQLQELYDFIQLPPVLDPVLYIPDKITLLSSLYTIQPTSNIQDSLKSIKRKCNINSLSINTQSVTNTTRRSLWLNAKHVINLKKQMHQLDDPFYANILKSMYGRNLTEDQKLAL